MTPTALLWTKPKMSGIPTPHYSVTQYYSKDCYDTPPVLKDHTSDYTGALRLQDYWNYTGYYI